MSGFSLLLNERVAYNQQKMKCYISGKMIQLFSCSLCNYESYHKCNLKRHILKHTGEKPFQCEFFKLYSTAKILMGNKTTTMHECDLCWYSSIYLNRMKDHIMTYIGEKPFECIPFFPTQVQSRLLKPLKVHRCGLCSYTSHFVGDVKKHLYIHTGEKPHKCAECGRAFSDVSAFRRHSIVHVRRRN
ncbi:hypothetical protein TNIN_245511 [Trichonephila inaurata madagascariensis]|uniref:C2H2-type domain-containing protein n=1 Tax=Trichonephila inaurata madagascariensis TaxID=2747483 RepID=A0A8X7CTW7_9ARAC|nr:hypothetical protein TNIN_245511 [Trichonephila inaurata madagascariensis]